MVATETQTQETGSARNEGREEPGRTDWTNKKTSSVVSGLGWFSIGLGLAELAAPGAVARFVGIHNNTKTRSVLRGYGVRELAAGIGILSQQRPARWMWGRVAGDAVDIGSLLAGFGSGSNNKGRLAFSTAAVAGVTALDVICAQRLSGCNGAAAKADGAEDSATKVTKTIILNRSAEEAYRFWKDFQNLPKFMTYLESVTTTGDGRSHWVANGPAGMKAEWDAELVSDEPNRLIAWKSVDTKMYENAGSVRFEQAPGNRGALVRVEMDFAPNGGVFNSVLGKIFGTDLGQRIMHDLRNFKQVLELGEVTQSDASIHSGMHAAQPSPANA